MLGFVMDLLNAQPLFALKRGSVREVAVFGVAAIARGPAIHTTHGDVPIVARSLLKPWQFLNCEIEMDAAAWLLAVSSQAGQDLHQECLGTLEGLTGINVESLSCPPSLPMDQTEAERCRAQHIAPARRFHPCAGKHLAHRFAAARAGFSQDYLAPEHPLQRRLEASLAATLRDPHHWVVDSLSLIHI